MPNDNREEFKLVMSLMNPNWVDVIFAEGPRYMINVANWSCTCTGDTIEKAKAKAEKREAKDCRHLKDLKVKIQLTR